MHPDLTFTRRDIVIGLIVVLVAFAFRLVIIVDRANANDRGSAFDPLPEGTDQQTYYTHIAAFDNGSFPPATYFYQPGMSYFMIGVSKIMRTDSPGAMRVMVAALAALNCGLLIAVTRLAVGKRSVAVLAGLLLAIYPVGAFYDTDFVITSQTTELITLALFGILILWRYTRQWVGAVIYGASFGILAFTRFEPVFLAPVFGLWLIWVRRERLAVLQVTAAAVVCVVVLLPIVVRNLSNGANYLITPVGAAEIYRGNNRDADGTYAVDRASQITQTDYYSTLWKDIRLSPKRFVELVVRKAGLYLSWHEPGNNLNYEESGENVSALLRAVPLDFRILLALFMFGLVAMFRQREQAIWLLGASFIALMLAIMLIWVEARLRTPAIVLMIPACAYGIVYAIEQIWQQRQVIERGALLRLLAPIPVIVLILGMAEWAYDYLPRPATVDHLPDSARAADAGYDDILKLVGWQVEDQYTPAGRIEPLRPYVITLYWELLKPTSIDYSFSLSYVINNERIIGYDRPVGSVSYPAWRTSEWATGKIYVEHVGLNHPQYEGPIDITAPLLLSVYPERHTGSLLPASGDWSDPTHIAVDQIAISWGQGYLPEGLPQPYADVRLGKLLTLKGWLCPTMAQPGETITLTLGWQTMDNQIKQNLIFSVWLLDAASTPITNADSPPQNGKMLATSLPTNFAFGETKQLTMPEQPGTYTLYALVYDYETRDRLAVSGSPDSWVKLGDIEIK